MLIKFLKSRGSACKRLFDKLRKTSDEKLT